MSRSKIPSSERELAQMAWETDKKLASWVYGPRKRRRSKKRRKKRTGRRKKRKRR